MRIGEEVFAVHPRRRWSNAPNNDGNGPDAGSLRRLNYVMYVLAKCAIRVSCTVRMEMHQLNGSAEDEQEGE